MPEGGTMPENGLTQQEETQREEEELLLTREDHPPDAEPGQREDPGTKPRTGAVKKCLAVIAGVILLIYVLLSVNERFGLIDRLPAWDDIYFAAGLRSPAYTGHEEGTVSVHFIDVGQGDCALIRTGQREILIDCGEYDEYTKVAGYLRAQGISRLDTVIMSHPHSDHMGCMYRIIRRFGAGGLVMPEIPEYMIPFSSSFSELMKTVNDRKIPVTYAVPGEHIDTGGCGTLEVTAPVRTYDDLNNFSDVVRFTYGEVSFLFTGDIESEAEADILDSGADISADILKVPHHGSGTSSSRLFVQAVSPEYAVISVGHENDYGHPHNNIVQLYRDLGADILRTDLDGDIVFVTDGENIEIYTGNDAQRSAA